MFSEKVSKLTDCIPSVNVSDNYGQTPLHFAAYHNETEIIKILLENGANPNLKNKNGKTPIHLLAMYGPAKSMKVLLNYGQADVEIADNDNQTPLDSAKKYEHTGCLILLKEYCIGRETFDM